MVKISYVTGKTSKSVYFNVVSIHHRAARYLLKAKKGQEIMAVCAWTPAVVQIRPHHIPQVSYEGDKLTCSYLKKRLESNRAVLAIPVVLHPLL